MSSLATRIVCISLIASLVRELPFIQSTTLAMALGIRYGIAAKTTTTPTVKALTASGLWFKFHPAMPSQHKTSKNEHIETKRLPPRD